MNFSNKKTVLEMIKMKKILIALNIVIWSLVGYQAAHAEAVMKKVCHEEKGKQVTGTLSNER